MKTYKIIKTEKGYIVEQKDKKTGNRINLFNTKNKVAVFETEEAAKKFLDARKLRPI